MKNTIIQWNCRGLRANYDELQLLLNDYDPAVVCLQETYLKESNNASFRNHRIVPKLSRREEIILARLRIGHTRLTHSYLLKREEQPYCIGCDTPFTVRHFLLDCADFDRERRSLFQVNNLKDLFKDVSVENMLSFLKNVNLFNKI